MKSLVAIEHNYLPYLRTKTSVELLGNGYCVARPKFPIYYYIIKNLDVYHKIQDNKWTLELSPTRIDRYRKFIWR